MDRIELIAHDEENNETTVVAFDNDDINLFAIKVRAFASALGFAEETIDKMIVNPYGNISLLTEEEANYVNIEELIGKKVKKIRNNR